jgi:hypothetical protein
MTVNLAAGGLRTLWPCPAEKSPIIGLALLSPGNPVTVTFSRHPGGARQLKRPGHVGMDFGPALETFPYEQFWSSSLRIYFIILLEVFSSSSNHEVFFTTPRFQSFAKATYKYHRV